MRKIHWYYNTGFVGAVHEDTVEVEDDATDEEISDIVYDEVLNYIDWGWNEDENNSAL